jgi:hypothetical protein
MAKRPAPGDIHGTGASSKADPRASSQATRTVPGTTVTICNSTGFIAGALPPYPRPSLGDGEQATVISSPGQAEPYPGTPGVVTS